jgi:hypothetical protein
MVVGLGNLLVGTPAKAHIITTNPFFMAKKSKPTEKQPKVHDELKGFDIKINAFGELNSSLNIERLNQFLNEKVDDIKLRDRKQAKEEEE